MAAPFHIYPATPADAAEILGLEHLCCPAPWEQQLVRTFVIASDLPEKGYLARVLKAGEATIAYALASRQDQQLLVERFGVRPENRRQGVGSGLMVSLILTARNWKLLLPVP